MTYFFWLGHFETFQGEWGARVQLWRHFQGLADNTTLYYFADFLEEWLYRLNTTCGRVTTYRGVQLIAAMVLWID